MATRVQRIENAAIAVAVVLAMIAAGQPWWLLLAAFLLFDLSAVGYLAGNRAGAVTYNLIHNYAGPAIVILLYLSLLLGGQRVDWLAILAACWSFHVALDRALGYGLKLENFGHTHLGGSVAAPERPNNRFPRTPPPERQSGRLRKIRSPITSAGS